MTSNTLELTNHLLNSNSRKSTLIYNELRKKIVLGHLTDTSPITEQSLAQEYGCSQGTIREALMSLQQDGLVSRKGYSGTYVTKLTEEEVIVLIQLRINLECAGFKRAAERITPEGVEYIRKAISEYNTHRDRLDAFLGSEMDRHIHMKLFELADMPTLEPILRRALLQLHRYVLSRHGGRMVWRVHKTDPHLDILEHLENGRLEDCDRCIRRHIAHGLASLAPELHDRLFTETEDSDDLAQTA